MADIFIWNKFARRANNGEIQWQIVYTTSAGKISLRGA